MKIGSWSNGIVCCCYDNLAKPFDSPTPYFCATCFSMSWLLSATPLPTYNSKK